jgi:hypothetical protein
VDQSHFLWHNGERPDGCHHQPRLCLLKGCERLFWPRHWRAHYCSEACRQAARRWRRWRASQQYRATENGRVHRQDQQRRYRQRRRERPAASADEEPSREGQRISNPDEDLSTRPCARAGCYELLTLPHEHSCQRFCSHACRLALRRVLDREARYQARRRHLRKERVRKRRRPLDSS